MRHVHLEDLKISMASYVYIKMSSSESRPRKVELMHTHSKNVTTTESILHITMKFVFVLMKTSLIDVIFTS